MKRGLNLRLFVLLWLMVPSRYTLPIGAVDTHRSKPSASHLEVPLAFSAREYYGKNV